MAAVTSIGAGASNTVIGMATAYTDSTSAILITGGPPTHMRGHGLLQELERYTANDFPKVAEAVSKRHWAAHRVERAAVHHAARSSARCSTGRPGPVHLEIPMDVQAETADVDIHDLARTPPRRCRPPGPGGDRRRGTACCIPAERPVIVVGGGAITGEASAEILRARRAAGGSPVVTTWNGKGAFPEDHELFAGSVGQTGTPTGNAHRRLRRCGHRRGLPLHRLVGLQLREGRVASPSRDAKLIHIDVDPQEIGKNYPADRGHRRRRQGDASKQIIDALPEARPDRSVYETELAAKKEEWEAQLSKRRDSDRFPFTYSVRWGPCARSCPGTPSSSRAPATPRAR